MIEKEFLVTEEDTALAVGSGGLPVLATPRLAAMVEADCLKHWNRVKRLVRQQ